MVIAWIVTLNAIKPFKNMAKDFMSLLVQKQKDNNRERKEIKYWNAYLNGKLIDSNNSIALLRHKWKNYKTVTLDKNDKLKNKMETIIQLAEEKLKSFDFEIEYHNKKLSEVKQLKADLQLELASLKLKLGVPTKGHEHNSFKK